VFFIDTIIPGACNQSYVIQRVWHAVDACGNEVTRVQTITVVDTMAPSVSPPPDKEQDCSVSTDPAQTGRPNVTDNCDDNPTVSFNDTVTPGRCPQEKIILRQWVAIGMRILIRHTVEIAGADSYCHPRCMWQPWIGGADDQCHRSRQSCSRYPAVGCRFVRRGAHRLPVRFPHEFAIETSA
jgi:hypothetical protein